MAKCPNCGLKTARTEDWCCQWCGYPLLYGPYKKIEKTYRELKEERLTQQPDEEAELEAELEPEAEFEPEVEPEPMAKRKQTAKSKPAAEPEPEAELESEAEAEPEPEAVPEPIPEPEPAAEPEPEFKFKPADKPKSIPKAKVEPEPVLEAEPEPALALAAMELTVEELISAYQEEGEAADARFANQIIRIKGVVGRIEVKDNLDIYYITLKSAGKNLLLQNVRCVFNRKHGPELSQLTTGQTVTVQGIYVGSVIDLSLRDCVLVR